jgi:hypothetical protein
MPWHVQIILLYYSVSKREETSTFVSQMPLHFSVLPNSQCRLSFNQYKALDSGLLGCDTVSLG